MENISSVYMDTELWQRARVAAAMSGRSRSAWIADAVRRALAEDARPDGDAGTDNTREKGEEQWQNNN